MNRKEAAEEYAKALKEGQKEYKECLQKKVSANPVVLDEILDPDSSATCIQIGLVEIPIKRIIGTKTAGRISAFTPSFRPLLEPGSEFALKWISLCADHLGEEGIHDPLSAMSIWGISMFRRAINGSAFCAISARPESRRM